MQIVKGLLKRPVENNKEKESLKRKLNNQPLNYIGVFYLEFTLFFRIFVIT
jgi:hypothetical protein